MKKHNPYNNEKKLWLMLLAIIYLIVPIIGLVLTTFFIISQKIKEKEAYYFLFILLAIYIGLINATKTPVSDQYNYMNAYLLVPKQSFWNSLVNIYGSKYTDNYTTKEMGFGLLNIIGYFTSFGYYPLFILEFTVLLYILYFISIYNFFNHLKIENKESYILSATFILTFFTQFFNLTIHLQRQEIATALMIYAIVNYCINQKPNWLLVLISIAFHTSTAFFLPIFFIEYYLDKSKRTKVIALITYIILLNIIPLFATSLSSLFGYELYGIDRLSKMGSSQEDRFDAQLTLLVSIPALLISLKNIINITKSTNKTESSFYAFYISLIMFVLTTPDNTMQYRYFMMSYGFIAFILPLLYKKTNLVSNIYLFILPCFLIIRFYATFNDIVFDYAPVENILSDNIFQLLFYRSPISFI